MKNQYFFISLLVLIICVSYHSGFAQKMTINPDGYTITGKITGLDSGWVYLKRGDAGNNSVLDSTEIRDQEFSFGGRQDTPDQATLSLRKRGASLTFFLENANIEIRTSVDSFKSAVITGSPSQAKFIRYQEKVSPLEKEIAALNEILSNASYQVKEQGPAVNTDSIKNKLTELGHLKDSVVAAFIKANPSSIVAARVMVSNFLWNPDVDLLTELYDSLALQIQKSRYGEIVSEHVDIAGRLAIGNKAPDFSQPDIEGRLLSLSSLRGKYVLVTFWASWCGPCRQDNPLLVKAYNRFKNKGFTILGVSLDESKKAWINAVEKDHLNWPQVSDLSGLSNPVMQQYGVWVTPTNYLLNKESIIIGRNLFGEKLEQKLEALLK